ncbi:hypothetical protein FK531_17710 [Rhodococcus spelaei]|uniref:Uncharacterized protein n=1 Tax=Rhodococcus spelaei TaxID=2546320 RepID=A0A541B206_9NOCA|nr:hypothetical protein [Rhodococcus spelaei]TQF66346.1 hypothetical protein FK531_17710 [Rhodococcus spelaei]
MSEWGRRGGVLVDVAVIAAVVAAGTVVAGVLHDPGDEATAATGTGVSVVRPPVEYPTEIPGCDRVEPPYSGERIAFAGVGSGATYDDPNYPWFSGPKASAMSAALVGALPAAVDVVFASPQQSFVFEPMWTFGGPEQPEGPPVDLFGGRTTASGTVTRGPAVGSLTADVHRSDEPVPPCVAGELTRRTTLADGSVVDSQDTWVEYDGVRRLVRSADAYLPDGTRIRLSLDDRKSGELPLTVDELAAIALTPGLRASAPVPAGTPPPPASCHAGEGDGASASLNRGTVDRLNRTLDDHWQRETTKPGSLDRPLGSLQLAESDSGSVCEVLTVTTPVGESDLRVSITGGRVPHLPEPSPDGGFSGARRSAERLADGTVVERAEHSYALAGRDGADLGDETSRSVTVTRPSGTQVRVTSSAAVPGIPLAADWLESVATAPGLELSG